MDFLVLLYTKNTIFANSSAKIYQKKKDFSTCENLNRYSTKEPGDDPL